MAKTQSPHFFLLECKAYHPVDEVIGQCEKLLHTRPSDKIPAYISAPHSFIQPLTKKFESQNALIGAEIMLPADAHTFTGTIAAKTLVDEGAHFVLIGTPQEREACEINQHSLKAKIEAALDMNERPFICVNESWSQHQQGIEHLSAQLKAVVEGLKSDVLEKLCIVYRAEWINQSLLSFDDETLRHAYQTFRDAVHDALPKGAADCIPLVIPFPIREGAAAEAIAFLEKDGEAFTGLWMGDRNLSITR